MAQAAPFLALGGSLIGAVGQYSAGQHAADQSEQAAQVGRIQADQVDASYRSELNSTISNIRAIRASANAEPSPTSMAIVAKQTKTSDHDRMIDVGNKRMQADQDEADAKFRRSSATMALIGGAATGLSKFYGS
jgi:23S rRNA A2030 N6-methylase RlmJ